MEEEESKPENKVEARREWPGLELLLTFDRRYASILGGVTVAIFCVLITILITTNPWCKRINKYVSSNMFYILFGSLCGAVEFALSYYGVINSVEVSRHLQLEQSDLDIPLVPGDDHQHHDDELQAEVIKYELFTSLGGKLLVKPLGRLFETSA